MSNVIDFDVSRNKRDVKVEKVVVDPKTASMEEMMLKHAPNVAIGLSLVSYGYQVDVWRHDRVEDGHDVYACESACRDFGGDYDTFELSEEFVKRFWQLVDEFRKGK
jgi:hypothetical protein